RHAPRRTPSAAKSGAPPEARTRVLRPPGADGSPRSPPAAPETPPDARAGGAAPAPIASPRSARAASSRGTGGSGLPYAWITRPLPGASARCQPTVSSRELAKRFGDLAAVREVVVGPVAHHVRERVGTVQRMDAHARPFARRERREPREQAVAGGAPRLKCRGRRFRVIAALLLGHVQ